MRRVFWLGSLVFLLLTALCPVRADPVSRYVRAQMRRRHIPGVSVAVVRNGRLILARGYGKGNLELSAPATADTVYETLSITKQFTAAAILLLAQEGKLSLEDPISRYLAGLPADWSAIQVRHLLTHTSGIRDYTDVPGWIDTIREDRTPAALIDTVKAYPLQFQPGEAFRYCNAGYYLLGMIVEKVSGQRYGDFLQARIFGPLGMTATRLSDLSTIIPRRAAGYDAQEGRLQNGPFISPTQKWAAGAVLSTVKDLARWDLALESDRLLKKEWRERMWSPARLNDGQAAPYGFGNELDMDHGRRAAGHQGGGVAFNATFLRYLDDRLTVIVLCNETHAPSRPMARHIAALYLPELSYARDPGLPDTEPAVTQLLQQLLREAARGQVDPAPFSASAQKELVPFIQRVGPGYLGPLGPLQSLRVLERRMEPESRVYRYRAVYRDSTLLWTLTLTREGKVSSLQPTEE